jgi:GNAT superfamily N-acetyltransferase
MRRQGLGAALLLSAEQYASDAGRTLLVLDTVTGGDAERMYAHHGWQRCGVIPDYALWPDGRFCATTVLFKSLGNHGKQPLQA